MSDERPVYRVTLTIEAPDGSKHVESQEIPAREWAVMGQTEIMQMLIPLHASVRQRWFQSSYLTP